MKPTETVVATSGPASSGVPRALIHASTPPVSAAITVASATIPKNIEVNGTANTGSM